MNKNIKKKIYGRERERERIRKTEIGKRRGKNPHEAIYFNSRK